MIKRVFLAIALVGTVFAAPFETSAAFKPPRVQNTAPTNSLLKLEPTKKGSIYFRAMADSDALEHLIVFPGYGFGYRRSFNDAGIDISINYSRDEQGRNATFWTAPKVSYIYYMDPTDENSLYAGAGLAWGGIHKVYGYEAEFQLHFVGLVPHVTVGYEFLRQEMIFSFTELTISQPLIASYQAGPRPGPVAELSIGAGF